jgi:hypothetical protein
LCSFMVQTVSIWLSKASDHFSQAEEHLCYSKFFFLQIQTEYSKAKIKNCSDSGSF